MLLLDGLQPPSPKECFYLSEIQQWPLLDLPGPSTEESVILCLWSDSTSVLNFCGLETWVQGAMW